VMLKVFFGFK